jgi:ankyrin repeat protein
MERQPGYGKWYNSHPRTTIQILAMRKANINHELAPDYTPLMWACTMNDFKLAADLVRLGARVNVTTQLYPLDLQDYVGRPGQKPARFPPIDLCCVRSSLGFNNAKQNAERGLLVKELIRAGAEIESLPSVKRVVDVDSPLTLAASADLPDVVRELIKAGAVVEPKGKISPFLAAVRKIWIDKAEWRFCE